MYFTPMLLVGGFARLFFWLRLRRLVVRSVQLGGAPSRAAYRLALYLFGFRCVFEPLP